MTPKKVNFWDDIQYLIFQLKSLDGQQNSTGDITG